MLYELNALERAIDRKISNAGAKRTRTAGVVSRVDKDGTVFVRVDGADVDTPVSSTTAGVAVGDSVSVRIENGRASIEGNTSDPSVGTYRVAQVEGKADDAIAEASRASVAAAAAESDAARAKDAADQAQESADDAATAASAAQASADAASTAASVADGKAVAAGQAASAAQQSATAANRHANAALDQLGVVQDVVGVLTWASEHGSFERTSDTAIVDGKVYFAYDGTDYTPVIDPQASQLSTYYELTVDEAMQSYIMAHLAVTQRGLWVLPSGIGQASDEQHAPGYKLLAASDGLYIYDGSGALVSVYGESIDFSAERAQHIGSESAFIVFEPATDSAPATVRIGGNVVMGGSTPLSKLMGVRYDSTWTKSGGTYAFVGYAYKGGVDVSADYPPDFFVWYLRNEGGETLLGRGRTCSVAQALAGYHGTVVGGLEDSLDCYLVDDSDNRLVTDDGAFVADLIWEV